MYKFYQSEKRGLHLSFHEYNGNIQQINIPKIKDTLLCYKKVIINTECREFLRSTKLKSLISITFCHVTGVLKFM